MAAALSLLLIGSLLHGALCGQFKAFMPWTIKVLSGSCVTIPCFFDIEDSYESKLDNTCRAVWKNDQGTVVFNSNNPQQSTIKGELRGDLTRKDCTTTLYNMQPPYGIYNFRIECNNPLKYNFLQQVFISVKADPPRPTLTPSTLKVKEGTSVTLTCSAPAPCLSHPPALTWSPGLGDSQETLQENQDKTKVMTSVVNFTASHLHHREKISCTAAYNKQDGSTESAVSTRLTADISYSPKNSTVSVHPSGPVPEDSTVTLTCSSTANPAVRSYTWYRADGGQEAVIGTGQVLTIKASKEDVAPQILSSSDCTKAAAQLSCSCSTVGNPSPTLQWYLDGLPVNHTGKFVIRNEPLNDTGLRSIITVNQPQERDLSSLLCHSSNSQGSASQHFCVNSREPQTAVQSKDWVMLPVFITTVVALLILVCALLFVIRAQKSQCTGDTSTVTMSQLLTSGEKNEVPNTAEEDIYVTTIVLRQTDVAQPAAVSQPDSDNSPVSEPNSAEGDSKSSEKKTEERNDVIYSTVNWKTKSKKKKGEEPVNMEKKVEREYAKIQFKDKSAMHK